MISSLGYLCSVTMRVALGTRLILPSSPAALAVLVHSLVKGAKKEIWRTKVVTGVKRTIGHVVLV